MHHCCPWVFRKSFDSYEAILVCTQAKRKYNMMYINNSRSHGEYADSTQLADKLYVLQGCC